MEDNSYNVFDAGLVLLSDNASYCLNCPDQAA